MSPLSKTRNNQGKLTMRLIQNLLFALALCGVAAGAAASVTAPVSGGEYLTLPEPQNTDAGAKVEVTEFFSYGCPHCNLFEPVLAAWVRKNQDKIVFKRVHVALHGGDAALQRLYSTFEAMGVAEQQHDKVFAAVHEQRLRLTTDEAVFDWAEKAGLDRAKLTATYRSFGTQARVNRAQGMTKAYQIGHWPMIAVGGRYMTSPFQAGSTSKPQLGEAEGQQAALKVMDFLVAKAQAEKK
jgi:thiol:disulfide interchange protein DsbA